MEVRGNDMEPDQESFWRSAFTALITGFASTAAPGSAIHTARCRPDSESPVSLP